MPARSASARISAGAHEALLLDELAGGVGRLAGSLQGLDERSALVLLHGCSTRTRLTISAHCTDRSDRSTVLSLRMSTNTEARCERFRPAR